MTNWCICEIIIPVAFGPVAQLGERSVRIREVDGSIPFRSTIYEEICKRISSFFALMLCVQAKRCVFDLYVFTELHAAETLELIKGDVEVLFDIVVPADEDGLDKLRHNHFLCHERDFAIQVRPTQQPVILALSVFRSFQQRPSIPCLPHPRCTGQP